MGSCIINSLPCPCIAFTFPGAQGCRNLAVEESPSESKYGGWGGLPLLSSRSLLEVRDQEQSPSKVFPVSKYSALLTTKVCFKSLLGICDSKFTLKYQRIAESLKNHFILKQRNLPMTWTCPKEFICKDHWLTTDSDSLLTDSQTSKGCNLVATESPSGMIIWRLKGPSCLLSEVGRTEPRLRDACINPEGAKIPKNSHKIEELKSIPTHSWSGFRWVNFKTMLHFFTFWCNLRLRPEKREGPFFGVTGPQGSPVGGSHFGPTIHSVAAATSVPHAWLAWHGSTKKGRSGQPNHLNYCCILAISSASRWHQANIVRSY